MGNKHVISDLYQIIFNCVAEVEERIDFKINRQMGRIKEREAKRDVC